MVALLVEKLQCFINVFQLRCHKYFVAHFIVGQFKLASRTFEFLKMAGDISGSNNLMTEKRTPNFST